MAVEAQSGVRTPRSPTSPFASSPADTTIEAADTLLLTVRNQLEVEHNGYAIESILKFVTLELAWR